MTRQPDHYLILGVSPDATSAEIAAAARTLAEKFPMNARDPAVNAAYRQLLAAYEVLSDAQRRAAYDAERARRAPELLEITTQLSRNRIAALENEQLLYLLATLRAPDAQTHRSLPLNLALVFDRSTSMSNERLARVKTAAREVVQKLSPDDVLSVITFSDRAEVVWPAAPVSQREQVIARINSIQTSGGTEILQGLQAGMDQLRRARLSKYVNHLILLTDGHTYGDEDTCLDLAQRAAAHSIALSAFGIGADWNDSFLDQLVTPSGGRSGYIERPEFIVDFLSEQVSGLGAIYAHNIRLAFTLPPGLRCNEAIKLSPFSLPLDCTRHPIQLGAVEMRTPLMILLELVVQPQRAGANLTIALDFQADIPAVRVRARPFQYKETLSVIKNDPSISPPPTIVKAVQMLNLHRMSEKAWQEFEAGQTEAATRRMNVLTTRLLEAGHTELAEQAEMEKQRLSRLGTLSPEGRKRLKYGTRSLLTTAVSFKRHD